ncbi:MAG: hypothetical protein IPL61_20495 [Myxococcales bacterium]|nr:hypothetical protein [Myxococcales bacterium]
MGLFDKKKKDDFGSPVEEISLTAARTPPGGTPVATATPAPAPAAPPRPPAPDPEADFGINKAIELMRQLPQDNKELVVTVVKTTLQAMNIKLATIISDADRKLKGIEGNVDGLRKEIADFEKEIATRKDKIASLEADHKETTAVKANLILAEKLAEKPKPSGAK